MAFTFTFGTVSVAQAGWLDANFQAAGLLGTLPCIVSGTNALTLTPFTTPTIPTPVFGLQAQVRVSGIAAATNTTAVTAAVGGTPALPVYKDTSAGPVVLAGNEIALGNVFTLTYDAALDSGGGGYHLGTAPASSAGTVTSVASGTGLAGGPITTTGTLTLAAIASHALLSNITGGSAIPVANSLTATIDAAIGATQGAILYRGASVWSALGPGTSGQFLKTQGAAANPVWAATTAGAVTQAQPANPTGTNSLTGLMMGLAGSITPTLTGRLMITISGDISNNTGSDGGTVQIRYGTGSAPANADALTGNAIGTLIRAIAGTVTVPFSVQAVVTGLSVGTAYWLDLGLAAITGGTASIFDVSVTAIEI
jgi:hypothetical protein